ncbi:MAG: hydroxyacid dehydrogenase [Clostridia bacterium]|nr:hydroxyacid dehydrogenase [Clostridia bacterium]
MKITVLNAATIGKDLSMAPLSAFGEVAVYDKTEKEEVSSRVCDADVLIINKLTCNEETLKDAKRLKLICLSATGYDNVDLAYCRKRGIAVCNVAGYSTDSVAQLTLSMVLALATNLVSYRDFVASGSYTKSGLANALTPVFHELCGKTWGIFGYGNIGKKVAAVADAMGCRVIVCKKNKTDEVYPVVSFEELCKESDILTVHAPLSPQTRGIFDAEHLALMKKDAILVNVARGALFDEAAVALAVKNGTIGGFGCDVYTKEPFAADHPYTALLDDPRVILTPHMAWGAYEARVRCLQEICKNIEAFLKGERRCRVDLLG